MEWYDFAVYGYFATVIGRLFFPSEDPAVSLIAAFGAFAAGFLVRPLGGLVFGRIGRRPLVIFGAALMTFGAIPLFHLIHTTDPATIFLGEIGFVVALGLLSGGVVPAMVSLLSALFLKRETRFCPSSNAERRFI